MNTLLNDPQYLGLIIAACCVLMTILAAPSFPLISVVSQALAKSQKKSFYDKFGKQLTRMSLLFGGTALAITALGAIRYLTLDTSILQGPYTLPLGITAGLLLLAALCTGFYFGVWKSMRKQKNAHMLIGLLAVILSFAALAFGATTAASLQSSLHVLPSVGTPLEILAALLSVVSTPFLIHLLLALVVGFALCGAFSLVYLLARREKDDFGRDYYKFAVPYAAKWAIAGAILQAACTAAVFGSYYFYILSGALALTPTLQTAIMNPLLIVWLAPMIIPLIACIFWIFIIMSAAPMRRKVSMYCGALLMLVSNLCLFFILAISLLLPVAS